MALPFREQGLRHQTGEEKAEEGQVSLWRKAQEAREGWRFAVEARRDLDTSLSRQRECAARKEYVRLDDEFRERCGLPECKYPKR